MTKISVIGAGAVGSTLAMRIAEANPSEVVLFDIDKDLAIGKALDIEDSVSIKGIDSSIVGASDYESISGSEVVVITAGFPRRPGMSREDLLSKNAGVVKGISLEIKRYAKNSIVIVVTNPLDVMSYLALKITGFEPQKVIGMAGVLDSARVASVLRAQTSESLKNIKSFVLGSHGDSMVILPKFIKVGNKGLVEILTEKEIEELKTLAKNRGAQIVNLLKSGSAYFAPSQAVSMMIESILKDKKDIMCVSAYLSGQYGVKDLYIGAPARIGRQGIEEIIEVELTSEEQNQFLESCRVVKDSISKLNFN